MGWVASAELSTQSQALCFVHFLSGWVSIYRSIGFWRTKQMSLILLYRLVTLKICDQDLKRPPDSHTAN